MEDESGLLGPGQVHWLASIVADGTATPDEARSLISEFVSQASAGEIDPRLIEHLRDCFAAYLVGEKKLLPSREANRDSAVTVQTKTLEKAFGLIRVTRGRPRIDTDTLSAVAMEFLGERLRGTSHQDALAIVAKRRWESSLPVSSETDVGAAWTTYKRDALIGLRLYRASGLDPAETEWTDEEIARLSEIYADVPGIVLPGEKLFEGRHAIPGTEHSEAVGEIAATPGPENPENKAV